MRNQTPSEASLPSASMVCKASEPPGLQKPHGKLPENNRWGGLTDQLQVNSWGFSHPASLLNLSHVAWSPWNSSTGQGLALREAEHHTIPQQHELGASQTGDGMGTMVKSLWRS